MEGHQARIVARIWDDPEWCALSMEAQWLYQSGLSQREIQASGILPLRESRWASLANDTDTEVIAGAMKRLVDGRFWVIDEEHGEVLYRSYMRTLEVWRFPNQLKTACVSAAAARGAAVRATLLRELLRFPVEHIQRLRPARKGHRRPWLVYVETVAALRGDSPDGAEDDEPPSDALDVGQMELPGEPFLPKGLPKDVRQLTSSVAPVIPIGADVTLDHPEYTVGPGLRNGLPKGFGNHMNYVVGGTARQSGLTTSGVECAAHTHAPAPASPPEPTAPFVVEADPPEPEREADPETLMAIAIERRNRKRARSLLAQPPLHGRALGLVDEQVDAGLWTLAPTGRELVRWRVAVSELLRDAIPEAAIVVGLRACIAKGFGAVALPTFVFGEANKRGPESRAERSVNAVLSRRRDDGGPGLAAFLPGLSMPGVGPPPREIGPNNE